MNTHRFASFQPQRFLSDDILGFEETFDTDSLKNFYQQKTDSPLQVFCSPFPSKFKSDSDSILSPDDRETQASPLVRYLSKFSASDSVDGSYFARQLSYPLFSSDSDVFEDDFCFHNQEPAQNVQPLSEINQNRDQDSKPAESKKIFEMKGNLSMTMSLGNITLNGKKINQLHATKELEEPKLSNFERLIKMKKIFKIEKDSKAKISHKLKSPASAQSPQRQTVKVPFTALRDCKGDSLTERILFKNDETSNQKQVMFNFTQKN